MTKLTEEQVAKAAPHVREAATNLLKTWNALRQAELAVSDDFEIDTDQLSGLCAGFDDADSIAELLDDEMITQFLNECAND